MLHLRLSNARAEQSTSRVFPPDHSRLLRSEPVELTEFDSWLTAIAQPSSRKARTHIANHDGHCITRLPYSQSENLLIGLLQRNERTRDVSLSELHLHLAFPWDEECAKSVV